ncbi:hypothetical protein [Algoriphagus sp. AK58]|uniref:hypothetical protein n=1 Tax=Algoriphagus sp. AK58 TaxID=1406877 RepID=UPI00165012EF|nr:hypothetical protein [Algoriphagus sp. AK58]MBC6367262.1 hypothetical protein [Algoriphagus sp. AK58]
MNSTMSNPDLSGHQVVKVISIVLKLLVFSLVCFSCTSREENEIKELMNAVFEWELNRGEEVIVFAEAEENWEIPWLDSCSVEGILSLQSDFRYKVLFKDVFTEADAEKICREGRQAFRFQQDMFPVGVKVSSEKGRYDSLSNAYYNALGKPEVVELDMELKKYMSYKTISKPVFLQDYQYAFLYVFSGGTGLLIYKKQNNKWVHYFTSTLMLI